MLYKKFVHITLMKLTPGMFEKTINWHNLVSISSTFYEQIFHTNVVLAAFSMYMEGCQNNICTINSYVKC